MPPCADALPNETILIDDAYFTSLLADINDAVHTIDIEMYIFSNDMAGSILSDALCHAAKRGVKIRILVDGIGSPEWGDVITTNMTNLGITSKIYHPAPWIINHWKYDTHSPNSVVSKFFRLLSKVNSRNHKKIFVIDRRIIYIGSANITNHLISSSDKRNIWRETGVKVSGIDPAILVQNFEKLWRSTKPKERRTSLNNGIPDNSIFRLNNTWRLRHIYYKDLLQRISNAKRRIWVTNSYFVPDSRLLKKLVTASKNGLDVRIMVPSVSDVFISSVASKMFYTILLENGASIYEYLPRILHAKSLIIDDWYLVGSSNLNYRSIRHDLEADAEIKSITAKETLDQQFLIDLKNTRKINHQDIKSMPFYFYILGKLILFFRYWI